MRKTSIITVAVRAALTLISAPSAAADRQVAEKAWDEGYLHGYVIGVEEGSTGRLVESIAPNPYRKEARP